MAKTKTKQTPQLKPFKDYDAFVSELISKLGLDMVPRDALDDLTEQIEHMVDVRIMDSILGSFSEEDFAMVDYLTDHFDDIDEMDAVLFIASEKPELAKRLEALMSELTSDLESYAEKVKSYL